MKLEEEKSKNTIDTNTSHQARQDFQLAKDMLTFCNNNQSFSNEQGKAQNQLYQEYLNGAVKENFGQAIELQKLEIALMRRQAEADIEIQRKQMAAELELDKVRSKIKEIKANKKIMWTWRIFWPALGVIVGGLTFILLYVIK